MIEILLSLKRKIASFSKAKKIILSALFLILLAGLALLLNQEEKREEAAVPKPLLKVTPTPNGQEGVSPSPAKETFTANEITQTTIAYLDSQKRPDGFYDFFAHYEERCQDPSDRGKCPLGSRNMFEVANMWVILARLSFYQNFSESPKDLAQAEEDARALVNFCQQDARQCLATVVPFINLYGETKKETYKAFIEDLGKLLLQESYGSGVMALAGQARELTLLYEVFSDRRFLDRARQRLAEAKTVSETDQQTYGFDDEACYLTLAQTELGRVSDDQELLSQAAGFFREGKDKDIPGEMTLIQPCIESVLMIGELQDDKQIQDKGLVLLDQYVLKRWDGPGLGKGYQGGGFVSGSDPTIINITDTGYMIYLLGLAPERKYSFNSQEDKAGVLGLTLAAVGQSDEPGGAECLEQADNCNAKMEATICTGTCSDSPPEEGENCQCRSAKSCQCTDTCVWGYCGNTACTNYNVNCRYWWDCDSSIYPTPTPGDGSCDCWRLSLDHPDLSWVKRGESLDFIAEAYVAPVEAEGIASMSLVLDRDDEEMAHSGEVEAVFSRTEEIGETSIAVYQVAWSWTVPTDEDSLGLYHLHLNFNCPEENGSQAFSEPTPSLRFKPPFPTVVRPTAKTLQLGTFYPVQVAQDCYDLYFQVAE